MERRFIFVLSANGTIETSGNNLNLLQTLKKKPFMQGSWQTRINSKRINLYIIKIITVEKNKIIV